MTESNATNISGFVNTSSTSTNLMDDLVKEYLLFRGFNTCLKSFEIDSKQDKDKSLKADKIVEQLFQYIYSFDLSGLLDYWSYLDLKYFSRLTLKLPGSLSLTRKYELFLLRYYLINAIQSGKSDKALEFFETYSQKLQSQIEWKEWFCLPFLKNPEENSTFAVYFSKNWIDSFYISLQNFLNIVFQSIQYPRLLNYEEDSFWLKQQQQQQQQLNYSTIKDDCLTDEFHQLETSNQNKTSNSLISIFKNFKTGNFASNNSSNISNSNSGISKQNTSTRIKLFSKKINSESTTSPSTSSTINNNNNNNNNSKAATLRLNEDANNKLGEEVAAKQLNYENPVTIETDSPNKQKQAQESKLVQKELKLESAQVAPAPPAEIQSSIESPFLILSEEEFREHKSSVLLCKVSRDGKYVASLDTQGIAKIWSLDNKQNALMLKGTFMSVEWDKKSNKLVYLGTNKPAVIKVYDLNQKKIIQELEVSKLSSSSVILMSSIILNSKLACVVTNDNQPDCLVMCSQVNGKLSLDKQINLETTFQVKCLAQCGQFWLGSSSGSLKAFDSDSSKFTLSLSAHKKELLSILANKDQTKLFTQSTDNTIKTWLISGQKIDLIKTIDLQQMNITDYVSKLNELSSGTQATKSLFAADSSDNFYLLTRSSVNFIEIASEKINKFLSTPGLVCTTSIEIWSASHSSILFVAYSDGLIKIYKILSHI